ncbi:hypothetical protein C0J52_26128 [Blattella germanica]|nr:hypothetical protein C0J52_26128 [Blattella germanica]
MQIITLQTEAQISFKTLLLRTEEQQSFRTVNPFVIQKGLDAIAGPVKSCSRQRNGCLLVETFRSIQTEMLLRATQLHTYPIKSFGSKESYDQTGRSSTSYSDIVFTFVLLNLPTNIKAGYEVIPLRPYIRALLRCFQCQQYRHSRLNCRRTEVICMTCAQIAQEGECVAPPRCAAGSGDHIVISKQCPRFIEEQKIQEICTFERISFQEARQKVHALHPTFLARGGFSTVVAAPVHKTSIATQTDATPVNPTLQPQVVTLQKKQIATVSENPLQKGSSSINNHINPYTPRRQSPVLLPYRHSRSRTPIIRPPKTKDLPDISPSSSSGSDHRLDNKTYSVLTSSLNGRSSISERMLETSSIKCMGLGKGFYIGSSRILAVLIGYVVLDLLRRRWYVDDRFTTRTPCPSSLSLIANTVLLKFMTSHMLCTYVQFTFRADKSPHCTVYDPERKSKILEEQEKHYNIKITVYVESRQLEIILFDDLHSVIIQTNGNSVPLQALGDDFMITSSCLCRHQISISSFIEYTESDLNAVQLNHNILHINKEKQHFTQLHQPCI